MLIRADGKLVPYASVNYFRRYLDGQHRFIRVYLRSPIMDPPGRQPEYCIIVTDHAEVEALWGWLTAKARIDPHATETEGEECWTLP